MSVDCKLSSMHKLSYIGRCSSVDCQSAVYFNCQYVSIVTVIYQTCQVTTL